jgi:hypothetical protein
MEGREALWGHPDLLPTAEDFDDPAGFVRGRPELDMSALDGELPADPASPADAASPADIAGPADTVSPGDTASPGGAGPSGEAGPPDDPDDPKPSP